MTAYAARLVLRCSATSHYALGWVLLCSINMLLCLELFSN